jgi:murein DD-endopeptidase MepM/ murein hydrolase activator NlpD
MRRNGPALLMLVVAVVSLAVPGAVAAAQTTIPTSTEPTTSTTLPPTTTPTTTTSPSSTTTTGRTADSPAAPPADDASDSVHAPTPAEASAAQAAFTGLTDDQRALLRRLQTTRDDLAATRVEAAVTTAAVDAAQARWAAAERAARQSEGEVTDATRTLDRAHDQVARLAEAMYHDLDADVVLDAVNTSDRGEVNRVRTYSRAPERVLQRITAQAQATRRALVDARARAEDSRAAADRALADAQQALGHQRDALAAAEDASTRAAAAVTAALGANVALLTQVADPHFGADQITAALAVAQAGRDDPATLFGLFRIPVPGAPLGSPYGVRVDPLSGALGYHPGIDFEAPAGAEVHAAAPGTVVMAGDCGGYGNCVVIDHGHSTATVSAHLSRILVAAGQPIADGQVVGLVGSTGLSTGPHLHFEVRVHGVPIDPALTLVS